MSYHSETQTIQIYSYLFNPSIPKDDKYWCLLLESNIHELSLDATFKNIQVDQIQKNSKILNDFFKQCLERLDNSHSMTALGIFIKNVCGKNYGEKKNEIVLKIFGGINELNDNIVKFLKLIKKNLNQDDDHKLKNLSFKLFAEGVKGFYNTLVFEIFYQIDLNDELYNLFLIEKLPFEIIGQIFVTLSILTGNSLVAFNSYKLKLGEVFEKKQILSNINYQLKQFLIFGILFYHGLSPDLLDKKEQNSSFYNWVTFNRYNTKISDYRSLLLQNCKNEDLKHFLNVKRIRYDKGDEFVKELIPIYSFLFSLTMNNKQYGDLFTTRIEEEEDDDDDEIELLEIFLSLASFVLQYQYKYNKILARLNLIILNELISKNVENLSNYYIDQYRIKICYQRQPIVDPIGEIEYLNKDNSALEEAAKNKNSLYYILDVIQCQLRFNLSKKLDLINYKLSNLIILQVLNAVDYEQVYNWHDLFQSIFLVFNFLTKNFSGEDEKILSLIEEILIIVEISLTNFYSTDGSDHNTSLIELVYKILESSERLTIVKRYNKGNLPNLTILLNLLITKFSSKVDLNYNEIYQELNEFMTNESEFKIINNGLYEKVMKQDVEYEQLETFKYLRMNSISSNNKISLSNKCIEEMASDHRLFH